ncbi:MAG: alpha/beta hydrolase [Bacteroidales bacterium]|nr:alpha/beta hydrolase [Bacteroidales bacterium]
MNKMKVLLLMFSLFMTVFQLRGQDKQVIDLWPEGIPEEQELLGAVKIEQDTKQNNHPDLTVYLPQKPNGKAIIMCPGGGYSHLAINHEGHDMADWFNAQGIAYFVLKYRLPDGCSTIPFTDAERAIEIVRKKAVEWNIDPNQVGIMGASAGGHLASTLATHAKSEATRPNFQILLYPVITMDDIHTHKGSQINLMGKNPSDKDISFYSNESRVTKETPPAFIVLSSDDKDVSPVNSLRYYYSLILADVPVALFSYPIGGHGWGFRDSFVYKKEWTSELEKWLEELN